MSKEDFAKAYLARRRDFEALPVNQDHAIAIFHLGGVAIECRLKSLLLLYHEISQFNEKSNRKKDPKYKQDILNPSHGLLAALKGMHDFYKKAVSDKHLLTHLQVILYPLGSMDIDYISLRYIPQTAQSQKDWKKSFDYVCGWLEKNERIIL